MTNFENNALTFDCPECKHSMTVEFREDFHPKDHPNCTFCCMACGQEFLITNWEPIWIIRHLPPSATVSRTIAQA